MTTAQAIVTPRLTTMMSAKTNEYSRNCLWTGRVLTGFSGAFFIFDACMKLLKPPPVVRRPEPVIGQRQTGKPTKRWDSTSAGRNARNNSQRSWPESKEKN
jgi:hypothetical protein